MSIKVNAYDRCKTGLITTFSKSEQISYGNARSGRDGRVQSFLNFIFSTCGPYFKKEHFKHYKVKVLLMVENLS